MVTIAGREPGPSSRLEATREILARRRRNLLLPILLLVAVSLVAVSGLLYWSAVAVNERGAEAQRDLVRSVVQIRRETLRQLVTDYARREVVARIGSGPEASRTQEQLARYLQNTWGIAAGWVLAADGQVRFAFENGRPVAAQAAPALPAGGAELVARARAAGRGGTMPAAGFALFRQDLALIAAGSTTPLSAGGAAGDARGGVLVFVQPMDLTLLARAGVGEHIAELHFLRGGVPPGYLGCEIKGEDGKVFGSVVWRDQRAGDAMLWSVAPLLLLALVAVCVLLVLVIKRVGMVVTREGRLSISLHQEKQRRSQKSNFVSMVSHELRTPLQAIGTAAGVLEHFGDRMSAAERREETTTIRRGVATLARLVDDVLVLGRAEAAEGDGGAPVDLPSLCRAVWREVSVALRSRQQMLLRDEIGAPVHGLNEAAIYPILSNLMQNAIKYSRGIGDIDVRLSRDGDFYAVAVTDSGPGVPAEEREAIFRPYWRSEQVADISGTGLGLLVARSAARALGGDLRVEPGGEGEGARFVLRWPRPAPLRDDETPLQPSSPEGC